MSSQKNTPTHKFTERDVRKSALARMIGKRFASTSFLKFKFNGAKKYTRVLIRIYGAYQYYTTTKIFIYSTSELLKMH